MGCVRKRGNSYQAQVRRTGCQPVSKTFVYRQDAEKWVREIESRIDRVQHHSIQPTTITLGELLRRYRADITPSKKGRGSETRRLNRLLNDSISLTPLSDLSGAVLSRFRDRRIKDGKRAAQYDLVLIRHAIEVGRKEWGIALPPTRSALFVFPTASGGVNRGWNRMNGSDCNRLLANA